MLACEWLIMEGRVERDTYKITLKKVKVQRQKAKGRRKPLLL